MLAQEESAEFKYDQISPQFIIPRQGAIAKMLAS
jgi:hypothetical protein